MAKVQISSELWQEIPFTILVIILELTSLQPVQCLEFETGNPNNFCANIQVHFLGPESLHGRLFFVAVKLSSVFWRQLFHIFEAFWIHIFTKFNTENLLMWLYHDLCSILFDSTSGLVSAIWAFPSHNMLACCLQSSQLKMVRRANAHFYSLSLLR